MSDTNEKGYDGSDVARTGTGNGTNSDVESAPAANVPYKRPGGLKGLYMAPLTQICLVGLVCFMCPGLFNALNGLGGGGQLDHTTSANANSALYATFAFFAFFAGYVPAIFTASLCPLIL